ncbi:MAG: beta-lactamase family protein [Verrucomicrobia bacterium]|nr:beta-lactamase family protein [Verrucomicrobiota bacterium]
MRCPTVFRVSLLATLLPAAAVLAQSLPATYAVPRFTDDTRRARVESVLPELDKMFTDLATEKHLPGLVYGVVLDGQLIHARALGFANLERKIPAAADTRFRIASMTKSFVALAILRLRDAGQLTLDDPVAKHLPEFRAVRPPTADSPPITIRNLLTMTPGLPEDNPWGDRQMAITNEALERFVGAGLSFSTPPGESYEYSNLGFVLLGKIVSKTAGQRFQDYITQAILRPLGMKDTVWEYAEVPPDKLALGYHWLRDQWQREPILHDGDGAAMGGLITTLDDFARYVAFHLAAWPARDDTDGGPVRRATVREMQQPRIFSGLAPNAQLTDGKTPNPAVNFYGYGLGWSRDQTATVKVGHSGGLPGYGSNYRFAPDHGLGVMAFSNLRYGPVYAPTARALSLLLERAALPPRRVPVSPILAQRKAQVVELIRTWSPALVTEITAENFLLDRSLADWAALAKERFAAIGAVASTGEITPENQLRGAFDIIGEKAKLRVFFTLTPERTPKIQELDLRVVIAK